MQKKKKCQNCGGAFVFNIPNSFFQREEHLSLNCPYCRVIVSFFIEDGLLIAESNASPYLKQLPEKRISAKPWVKLIR